MTAKSEIEALGISIIVLVINKDGYSLALDEATAEQYAEAEKICQKYLEIEIGNSEA